MKKIWTICNTGLGSSFFIEMNINDILKKHGKDQEYRVGHSALYDIDWAEVDYIVVARDLESCVPDVRPKIILDSIIDVEELEQKLLAVIG